MFLEGSPVFVRANPTRYFTVMMMVVPVVVPTNVVLVFIFKPVATDATSRMRKGRPHKHDENEE